MKVKVLRRSVMDFFPQIFRTFSMILKCATKTLKGFLCLYFSTVKSTKFSPVIESILLCAYFFLIFWSGDAFWDSKTIFFVHYISNYLLDNPYFWGLLGDHPFKKLGKKYWRYRIFLIIRENYFRFPALKWRSTSPPPPQFSKPILRSY